MSNLPADPKPKCLTPEERQANEDAAVSGLVQQIEAGTLKPPTILLGDALNGMIEAAKAANLTITTNQVSQGTDTTISTNSTQITIRKRTALDDIFPLERNFYPDPTDYKSYGTADSHNSVFFIAMSTVDDAT